jgi:quinol-cytochrome oxidoreductase complex cytochrome b subunit/coenzyme F420-reducing hydrogenase delta subunit
VTVRNVIRNTLERIERLFDAAFTPAHNPFHHLGALGWFFYWIVVVSGIYLYIFFDTGITQAYASVEYLTREQWYAGGVMRSLHRYASDALVVVVLIHLAREWTKDRYRGKRWLAWVTGVPMLWFIYALGISGYWLVWDELAQYIAIGTTEWLDTLGIFGEPVARNFLDQATLTNRFFTLMVFVHILVPLLLLFIMWLHIQRNSRPGVNPPRALAAGTLAMLVALSFVTPALSHPAADLDRIVARVNPDWFYLPVYPLLDRVPGLALWAALGFGTLLLLVMPWLPPARKQATAVVSLENCNGCARCQADCPFNAIEMKPRSDGLAYDSEAVVDPDLCVACGICAGACPTSTPHRRAGKLVPGIDLPQAPVANLRLQVIEAGARLTGPGRIIVFGCNHGPLTSAHDNPSVAGIRVPCSGALPPAFIDFVISRGHADGVVIAGCREGDCHHRLGVEWAQQRIAGTRDPYLRARVPRERLATLWLGPTGSRELTKQLAAFRERLRALGAYKRDSAPEAP